MNDQLPPIGSLWQLIARYITLFPPRTELPDSVTRTINGEGLAEDAQNIRRDWQATAVRIDRETTHGS